MADHKHPVVDVDDGFVDWNTYIARMYVESDAFDAICVGCHALVTAEQNQKRKQIRAIRNKPF